MSEIEQDLQETTRSAAAFSNYCALGPARSLAKLADSYGKNTAYIRQLEKWSSDYKWVERAKQWDAEQARARDEIIAAERAKVLVTGYALMHKRVERLDTLVKKLIEMVDDEDKVWVPDVKSIGTGPTAERVDLVQFNDALFREIRAHFADIASELGERVKKNETTIKSLPKVYIDLEQDEDGSEE